MDNSLNDFIAHARGKGMDHQTIRTLLLSAGWKEKDVGQALVSETLGVQVPLPPDVGGAREGFLHLLSFVCLYTTVISLVFIYFTCLEWLLPDAALDYTYYGDDWSGLRWLLAMVIVTFPLFVWVSKIIRRDIEQHPEKARSALRRWLTYLTLLITALALVSDGVTLIWSLLEGELSLRFILKVWVVLVVAGVTFLYYLQALRLPAPPKRLGGLPVTRWLEGIAWLVVLGGLVWGFVLAGNPSTQRERRFDEQRVSDLQSIRSEMQSYLYDDRGGVPAPAKPVKPFPKTLQELADQAQYTKLRLVDPETAVPYEYRVISDKDFELCATFAQPRDLEYDVAWNHPAGRHCFEIDVVDERVR